MSDTKEQFENWLEFRLSNELGPVTSSTPKGLPRYRALQIEPRRSRKFISTPTAALAGFAAAFALSSGGAVAALVASHSQPGAPTVQATLAAGTGDTAVHGKKTPPQSATAGDSASNHGSVVSQAAQTCPTGHAQAGQANHGECVSAVARQNNGQAQRGNAPAPAGAGRGNPPPSPHGSKGH